MDCLIFKKVSVKCHALLVKTFSADISTLVEFSVSFMLPQKHSAAGRSRLPEIPSLFFLPALEGGELAIPKQLISASYPTHATAPVTVLTDRRLRSVGK